MALRIVKLSNRIESSGRMDGEIGDLFEKMEREIIREGYLNAGVSLGLEGRMETIGSGEADKGEGGGYEEEEGREG